MTRSLKKGLHVDERLIKKIKDKKPGDRTPIKTWSRSSVISPEMIGFTFSVHNGKDFISVFITLAIFFYEFSKTGILSS